MNGQAQRTFNFNPALLHDFIAELFICFDRKMELAESMSDERMISAGAMALLFGFAATHTGLSSNDGSFENGDWLISLSCMDSPCF